MTHFNRTHDTSGCVALNFPALGDYHLTLLMIFDKLPIVVTTENVNEDATLRAHMLADEQNMLITDIKSEFLKVTPTNAFPHFLRANAHLFRQQGTTQQVSIDLLRMHCTMGYHYMALLHIQLLLEFYGVAHATATPLNHLLSLLAEHVDISEGHYCQACKWRTNLRRCSACKWCYYCSQTCARSDRKYHKRTVCTKLIGRLPQDWGTARELEVMARGGGKLRSGGVETNCEKLRKNCGKIAKNCGKLRENCGKIAMS